MLKVDGKEAPAQGSVLTACRAAGADVPALCADDRLSPGGHCRSCMVEVDGRLVAACTTAARDGQTIRTETPALRAYREDLAELVLAEARPGGEVAETLQRLGATGARYRRERTPRTQDTSHPYLKIDLDACILCRRCLRACEEIQGEFVYTVAGRGSNTTISWGEGAFKDTDCVSCGACVATCPTGAITDDDRLRSVPTSEVVRTTCSYCGVGCQLDVHVADGRIQHIDGAASPVNHQHLCVKGRYAHGFVRHKDRLTSPLVRKNGVLTPVSWEEALAVVAAGFAACGGAVAGLSSSRCTNEENYLVQKWMRLLGTNDVDCCARVCHAPSAAGMRTALGTGAATNSLADIERAGLLMVIGANPTEAHPVTGARIRQAALRGTPLIVIDPRRTDLAAIADIHLQLRPGTNVVLFNSLAAAVVDEGLVNPDFLEGRVEGWDGFSTFIADYLPERTEAITGVSAGLVRDAARRYATATRAMMVHGLGVTEHLQGSEGVMALCNLALLTGNIGQPGMGVNPLRGQNNVQGAADMGCQPDLLTGYQRVADPAVRARISQIWGRPVPETPGRTLPQMYDAALKGDLKGLFILGEDVVQSDPNTTEIRAALSSLRFLVVQEIFPSATTEMAHVVLPGASFLEKDGTFTNGERRVQRVRKVVAPPEGAFADWEVLCKLMAATGHPQPYQHPAEIMDEVSRVWPAFAGISYARLEGDGLQWPVPAPDHPGTPILHSQSFPIGKGQLSKIPYVPSAQLGGALTLVTGRVLEHYNCGSMTRRTENNLLHAEDRLEIHPTDADARHIRDGAAVTITSQFGTARVRADVTERVRPGMVFLSFHHPETGTNELTSSEKDRVTGCPEYKITAVEVVAE